jgi:Leucine-rich repeat (LRR) protein
MSDDREYQEPVAGRLKSWFRNDEQFIKALTVRRAAERLQELGAEVFVRCGQNSPPQRLASIAGHARITSVTTVDFEKSDIPGAVFNLVSTLESVERLKFLDCRLSRTALETLGDKPQLKSLWFTRMPMIDDNAIDIICRLSDIESLVLWGTSVSGRNIALLRECRKLKSMQLGYSKFESRNIPQLLQLPALEDVSFWNLPLDDSALEHLSGCSWKKIAVGRTRITDAGLKHLESMPNLMELNLSQLRITNAGAETLSHFPSLKILNLSQTDINDQGLSSLGRIPSLQQLDVKGCDITDKAVSAFREQKPNCRILWDSKASQ